jgi:predicted porin
VAALNAAQAAASPGTLAATVSDNTAWTVQARYALRAAKLYAGFEHIDFADPARPLAAGARDIGGYEISVVNDTAYRIHKRLDISWLGLRYALTRRLDLTGAYYRYDQANFAATPCASASAASCAGTLNTVSLVADYRLSRAFDVYTGLTASRVAGGLAAGYLHGAVAASLTGVRFSF